MAMLETLAAGTWLLEYLSPELVELCQRQTLQGYLHPRMVMTLVDWIGVMVLGAGTRGFVIVTLC